MCYCEFIVFIVYIYRSYILLLFYLFQQYYLISPVLYLTSIPYIPYLCVTQPQRAAWLRPHSPTTLYCGRRAAGVAAAGGRGGVPGLQRLHLYCQRTRYEDDLAGINIDIHQYNNNNIYDV